jgi:hypothetical protein
MTEQQDDLDVGDLPVVTRTGDTVSMSVQDFDDLIARLLVAEGHACPELHCSEEHSDIGVADEALRDAVSALVEAHHRTHDQRFPWRLCQVETCRSMSFALVVS